MALLSVKDLVIHYETEESVVEAVNGISFEADAGETLGLVGETGAGKTTTALGLLRLIPSPPGRIVQGEIEFDGKDLIHVSDSEMRKIRGNQISMIFQDPMTALNPCLTVGEQVSEVIRLHQKLSREEAASRAVQMLEMVGITAERYSDYPHQFSGGMKQRVAIARAYAVQPEVLLMDEPFGALDAQTRTQLQSELTKTWQEENKTCFFVTHDIEEAIVLASRVVIMSARPGRIKEIIDIDIPHPRDQATKMSPRFVELKNYIWSQVYQEYLEVQK